MSRRAPRNRAAELDPRALLAGLAVVVLALAVLVVAVRSGGGLPGREYVRLEIRFPATADGTVLPSPGSDVRLAGRRIGQTRAAALRGGAPTLELQLDGGAPPLPADSRFVVRAQGVLGTKYVAVTPGDAAEFLADGGTVPARQSDVEVALSDVLGSLDARTRSGLRRTLRGLGGGAAGRAGRLNEALDAIALPLRRFSVALAPIVADGTAPPVVRAGAGVAGALDAVRDDLGGALRPGADALAAVGDRDRAVGELLRDGPGRLGGVRDALTRVDPTLRSAERFAEAARRFARPAPAALRATARLLEGARTPLTAAAPLLRDARAAVDPALHLLGTADPVLPRLEEVARITRRPSVELGAYGCDIGRFARRWRSMTGYAPIGQTGPLGPLTMLRVTIASAGIPTVPSITPGSAVSGDIRPCETKVAP
ncbi:MAG: hypothetical protein M0P31_07800 [Solirubrobacteraceae bacterium]|nr:hypothetical protein [Solirubrobacteraceae bacterium]